MSENKDFNIEGQIKTLILLVYCLICTAIFIIIPLWIRLFT